MIWRAVRSFANALLERRRALSYHRSPEATAKRDLRLDLLRGCCVFVMVADP